MGCHDIDFEDDVTAIRKEPQNTVVELFTDKKNVDMFLEKNQLKLATNSWWSQDSLLLACQSIKKQLFWKDCKIPVKKMMPK